MEVKKDLLIQAKDALSQLYDEAKGWSVSGVYFDEDCFPENVKALKNAAEAIENLEDALDKVAFNGQD